MYNYRKKELTICQYGCGNYFIGRALHRARIESPIITLLSPYSLLQWIHSALYAIEECFISQRGIPLRYYITCAGNVSLSNIILPENNISYIKSTKFKSDLIDDCIEKLTSTIVRYCIANKSLLIDTIVIKLKIFEVLGNNKYNFSILHNLIDEILYFIIYDASNVLVKIES